MKTVTAILLKDYSRTSVLRAAWVMSFVLFWFMSMPIMSFAQAPQNLGEVSNRFLFLVNTFIPVIITGALVFFLVGLVKFLSNADNEQERTKGKDFMIWGIVALFVMISVWSLVGVLLDTVGWSFKVPFFKKP